MKEVDDIQDDEIRIIGERGGKRKINSGFDKNILRIGLFAVGGILVALLFFWLGMREQFRSEEEVGATEQHGHPNNLPANMASLIQPVDSVVHGYTDVQDTVVNDVPMSIYIPYGAEPSLYVGRLNLNDTSIIYATWAADIRADNQKIVSAFVLNGEPLSWGKAKKGYCAIIEGKMTIGVQENTALFEEAIQKKGDFFRQYPLVNQGQLVENRPKGKAVRRALCEFGGGIFVIVETQTRESFHDFSQALVDLGVWNAIYLVGTSEIFGGYTDKNDRRIFFTDGENSAGEYINYIVWRRKG